MMVIDIAEAIAMTIVAIDEVCFGGSVCAGSRVHAER